jgi:hypothetical protein
MTFSDAAKPATALHGEPASEIEHLGGPLDITNNLPAPVSQVRCDLVGNDTAIAGNVKARGALDLCRHLLGAGVDPGAELLCFRDGRLALRVSSVGYGATIAIRETATDGPRVVRWRPFRRRDVSAPMRQIAEAVS